MAKRQEKQRPGPSKKKRTSSDCGSGSGTSSETATATATELSTPDELRSLCVEEGVKDDEVQGIEGSDGENTVATDCSAGFRGSDSDGDDDDGESKGFKGQESEMQQAVRAESVTASLPPGPDTYEKLYEFSATFARKLLIDSEASEVHKANLRATLSRQVIQHDAYSGLGTASITCRQQLEAMSRCLHSSDFACKLIVGTRYCSRSLQKHIG